MTEYAYEYGKRWHAETPRNAIRRYVDRLHVGTSLDEIADKIIAAMNASKDAAKYTKAIRRECLLYAGLVHDRNRDLYRDRRVVATLTGTPKDALAALREADKELRACIDHS